MLSKNAVPELYQIKRRPPHIDRLIIRGEEIRWLMYGYKVSIPCDETVITKRGKELVKKFTVIENGDVR